MPGFVLTTGSQVTCLHQGKATITPSQTSVLAGGTPVATTTAVVVVAPCSLSSLTPPSPCVTIDLGQAASSRVFASGAAVVLEPAGPGIGLCTSANQAKQGTPVVTTIQQRVVGG